MTAILREREVPYVVLTPTAAGEVDEALYHRLLRGQRASSAELLHIAERTGGIPYADASHSLAAAGSFLTALGKGLQKHKLAVGLVAGAILLSTILLLLGTGSENFSAIQKLASQTSELLTQAVEQNVGLDQGFVDGLKQTLAEVERLHSLGEAPSVEDVNRLRAELQDAVETLKSVLDEGSQQALSETSNLTTNLTNQAGGNTAIDLVKDSGGISTPAEAVQNVVEVTSRIDITSPETLAMSTLSWEQVQRIRQEKLEAFKTEEHFPELQQRLKHKIEEEMTAVNEARVNELLASGITAEELQSLLLLPYRQNPTNSNRFMPSHEPHIRSVLGGGKPSTFVERVWPDSGVKQWLEAKSTKALFSKVGVGFMQPWPEVITYYHYGAMRDVLQRHFEAIPKSVRDKLGMQSEREITDQQIDGIIKAVHRESFEGQNILYGITLGFGQYNAEHHTAVQPETMIGVGDLIRAYGLSDDKELLDSGAFYTTLNDIDTALAESIPAVLSMKRGTNTFHRAMTLLRDQPSKQSGEESGQPIFKSLERSRSEPSPVTLVGFAIGATAIGIALLATLMAPDTVFNLFLECNISRPAFDMGRNILSLIYLSLIVGMSSGFFPWSKALGKDYPFFRSRTPDEIKEAFSTLEQSASSRGDSLLLDGLNVLTSPKFVMLPTSQYFKLQFTGGKDLEVNRIQLTPETTVFRDVMNYLIVRRAIGFAEKNRRNFRDSLLGEFLWPIQSAYALLTRIRYYPSVTLFVLIFDIAMVPVQLASKLLLLPSAIMQHRRQSQEKKAQQMAERDRHQDTSSPSDDRKDGMNFGRMPGTVWLYVLRLPYILAHELGHLFMGLLVVLTPSEFEVLPKREDGVTRRGESVVRWSMDPHVKFADPFGPWRALVLAPAGWIAEILLGTLSMAIVVASMTLDIHPILSILGWLGFSSGLIHLFAYFVTPDAISGMFSYLPRDESRSIGALDSGDQRPSDGEIFIWAVRSILGLPTDERFGLRGLYFPKSTKQSNGSQGGDSVGGEELLQKFEAALKAGYDSTIQAALRELEANRAQVGDAQVNAAYFQYWASLDPTSSRAERFLVSVIEQNSHLDQAQVGAIWVTKIRAHIKAGYDSQTQRALSDAEERRARIGVETLNGLYFEYWHSLDPTVSVAERFLVGVMERNDHLAQAEVATLWLKRFTVNLKAGYDSAIQATLREMEARREQLGDTPVNAAYFEYWNKLEPTNTTAERFLVGVMEKNSHLDQAQVGALWVTKIRAHIAAGASTSTESALRDAEKRRDRIGRDVLNDLYFEYWGSLEPTSTAAESFLVNVMEQNTYLDAARVGALWATKIRAHIAAGAIASTESALKNAEKRRDRMEGDVLNGLHLEYWNSLEPTSTTAQSFLVEVMEQHTHLDQVQVGELWFVKFEAHLKAGYDSAITATLKQMEARRTQLGAERVEDAALSYEMNKVLAKSDLSEAERYVQGITEPRRKANAQLKLYRTYLARNNLKKAQGLLSEIAGNRNILGNQKVNEVLFGFLSTLVKKRQYEDAVQFLKIIDPQRAALGVERMLDAWPKLLRNILRDGDLPLSDQVLLEIDQRVDVLGDDRVRGAYRSFFEALLEKGAWTRAQKFIPRMERYGRIDRNEAIDARFRLFDVLLTNLKFKKAKEVLEDLEQLGLTGDQSVRLDQARAALKNQEREELALGDWKTSIADDLRKRNTSTALEQLTAIEEKRELLKPEDAQELDRLWKQIILRKLNGVSDPYATLGLSQQASVKDAKRAFRVSYQKARPDTGVNGDVRKLTQVSEAYSVLGSPLLKRKYDELFLGKRSRGNEPLMGHGFSDAQVEADVQQAVANGTWQNWYENSAMAQTLERLRDVIQANAPPGLAQQLLVMLEDFQQGRGGRRLGVLPARYDDDGHYYLGFGTERVIGLAEEFFTWGSPLYDERLQLQATYFELRRATMTRLRARGTLHKSDMEIRFEAIQDAALMFWELSDEERTEIASLSYSGANLEFLEHHSANTLGAAIRDGWKVNQSPGQSQPHLSWADGTNFALFDSEVDTEEFRFEQHDSFASVERKTESKSLARSDSQTTEIGEAKKFGEVRVVMAASDVLAMNGGQGMTINQLRGMLQDPRAMGSDSIPFMFVLVDASTTAAQRQRLQQLGYGTNVVAAESFSQEFRHLSDLSLMVIATDGALQRELRSFNTESLREYIFRVPAGIDPTNLSAEMFKIVFPSDKLDPVKLKEAGRFA